MSRFGRESFQRTLKNKPSRERYLIMCEGKTERLYFEEVLVLAGLSASLFDIKEPQKSRNSPKQMYEDVCKVIRKQKDDPYKRAYLVFDKDDPSTLKEYDVIKNKCPAFGKTVHQVPYGKGRDSFTEVVAITTNHCFETWLLLHFNQNPASCCTGGDVWQELKNKTPLEHYDKAKTIKQNVREHLFAKTLSACENARRLSVDGDKNPSSELFILFDFLIALGGLFR